MRLLQNYPTEIITVGGVLPIRNLNISLVSYTTEKKKQQQQQQQKQQKNQKKTKTKKTAQS